MPTLVHTFTGHKFIIIIIFIIYWKKNMNEVDFLTNLLVWGMFIIEHA